MAFSPRMTKCECCRTEYLQKSPIQKFCCEACRNKSREQQKIEKPTLQQKIDQARALGMSYGKYVAMLEARERTV